VASYSERETARRAFVATLVVAGVVVAALALWKLKVLLSLLFLAFIIAAAMRPGVQWLAERRVPRPLGVALHYLALLALLGLLLWLVVPRALDQVQTAIGNVPTSRQDLHQEAKHSTGIKHEILVGLDRRLRRAPTATSLVHPAVDLTRTALEILIGIFFVFASAAYWVFERDRAMGLVLSLMPRRRRRVVRETWKLVDLSLAFWLIGLPYWLLLGVFAGLVEIVPVVGPLAAGVLAVGVGLTVSIKTAALAAAAVYGLRVFQDYVLNPRVLGHAVGLTPLVVLVGVSAVGLLFGAAYVPLATPFIAFIATLVDVIVRGRDPAKEPVPSVIFPAQETETAGRG
jgi:predicted PurR-regulated permease PerM